MKWLVRSFACCVLASGALAPSYGGSSVIVVYPPPVQSPPPPTTVVVPVERPVEPTTRQITYLIAFKDGTVRQAEQYWVSGATLYYVTPDRLKSEAPLASVDRALSERLNSEQNVAFVLPSGQVSIEAKSMVRPRTAHRTGTASRRSEPSRTNRKCCCVSK